MKTPLGTEFERTLDEVNFGISTNDALKNLLDRVDSQDLRYFVVSVILQRETGGNLAEIMESIAHIIRERFKFRDKIRVLSAEGKLSGVLLCALPFLIIGYLQLVNPTYLDDITYRPYWTDHSYRFRVHDVSWYSPDEKDNKD